MSFQNIVKKIVCILLLPLVYNGSIQAQNCFPITLIDSVTGCNGEVFPLNAVVPVGSTVTSVNWAPFMGLSNSTVLTPNVTVGNITTTYTVTVNSTTNTLFPNGDFSSTVPNFTTDYIPGPGGTFGPLSVDASYMITNDPNIAHINFPTFGDHTNGLGNMLVLNGSTVPNDDIWCQTIAVTPNTTYTFTVWAANCVGSNMPDLQFNINGVNVGLPVTLGILTGIWTPITATWTSGPTAGNATICLKNNQLAPSGNDFALDDFTYSTSCTAVDSVKVISEAANADFATQINLGCTEDTVTFIGIDLNNNLPITDYLWSFGDLSLGTGQTNQHVYQNQSTYNVVMIASNGVCADTVIKPVNIVHVLLAAFVLPNDSVCLGSSVSSFNSSAGSALTYEWDMGDNSPIITTTNAVYTYPASGNYTVTLVATDNLGCKDTATNDMYVEQTYPFGASLSADTICIGETIFITDTISDKIPSFSYSFGNGNTSTQHNPVVTYEAQGNYNITLQLDYAVCTNQNITFPVQVKPYPSVKLPEDSSFCPGITANISLNPVTADALSYLWSDGRTTSVNSFSEAGTYWLEVSNGYCSATDTMQIKRDCYLNIPNAFTPNADGDNDYFLPREILSSGLTSFSMQIFNRWGETVFSTNSLNGRGWDGKFGGQDQPMGAYVYKINAAFKNKDIKEFVGNVTLLR